jgi:energy-coupling factor transporter transmembrane protein EcfT
MTGIPFVVSALYLTLTVAFVVTLLERGYSQRLVWKTLRRWGKFLLLLVILGIVIQILTWIQENIA